MKSQSLAVPLLLVLLLVVRTVVSAGLPGGWSPIEDIQNPHVQQIGSFAVTEYNSQSKAGLVFDGVVSGETQVVAGTNYRLVISVKKGGVANKYQAIVWEKSWEKFLKLTSFKPVSA